MLAISYLVKPTKSVEWRHQTIRQSASHVQQRIGKTVEEILAHVPRYEQLTTVFFQRRVETSFDPRWHISDFTRGCLIHDIKKSIQYILVLEQAHYQTVYQNYGMNRRDHIG